MIVVEDDSVEYVVLKYGWLLDSSATVYFKKLYVYVFDGCMCNLWWVMEKIIFDMFVGLGMWKKLDFYEDEEVFWKYRFRFDAFRGSGYDRGYLVVVVD